MTAFANAATSVLQVLKAAAGVAVVYARDDDTANITATPGASVVESRDSAGNTIQATSADWLVEASDLVLADVVVTPQRGDQVRRTVAGVTTTYELLDPPFKPMDGAGRGLRLYSKAVKVE